MNEFLKWVTTPDAKAEYETAETRCSDWVKATNQELADKKLPVQVVNFSTIWTVVFKEPSRYNWMLQYYMRARGIHLSFVGTGRCLASMDYTPAHYAELKEKLVDSVETMNADGYWVTKAQMASRDQKMKTQLLKEVLGSILQVQRPLKNLLC